MEHLEGPNAQDGLAAEITQTCTVHAPNRNQPDSQNNLNSERPNNESPVFLLRVERRQYKPMLRIDEYQGGCPNQKLQWNYGVGELRSGSGEDHGLGAGRYKNRNWQRCNPQ